MLPYLFLVFCLILAFKKRKHLHRNKHVNPSTPRKRTEKHFKTPKPSMKTKTAPHNTNKIIQNPLKNPKQNPNPPPSPQNNNNLSIPGTTSRILQSLDPAIGVPKANRGENLSLGGRAPAERRGELRVFREKRNDA